MKKFLSLALALVMALSLCTFVATPDASADFTDSDQLSSKYAQQAADVIQAIEVMDGYDDGSFRPTAGLTRQAAAKIICNMILGPTTARALPTNANPFPDVLAGNQFSGYISYCAQQGIISGYADGTFRGNDPLSGYAYLKMLLGALNYSAEQEHYVGDNWKVNVAKTAMGIGLTRRDVLRSSDSDFDGNVQITREDAAIYAFNTLQADMVEYAAKNTIEIGGVVVNMGGGEATPQTWNTSSTSADYINAAKSDGNNQRPIVQFAERYFDRLRREPNVWNTYTQDDFGRPSIRWFWKGVEIGTYSRDADVSFVGGVKVNAIYNDLGMSSGDDSADLYINSSIPNNTALDVSRSNDKDLDKFIKMDGNGNSSNLYGDANAGTRYVDRIGDGTLIECFRNDANNHVDVCVISVYPGKVSAVKGATTKKDAYVTIDYQSDNRPFRINATGNNEFETEDFVEDDVVAYTYSDSAQEIKTMYRMSSASGTLQSRVATKSLRLDNSTYNYGKEYAFDGSLREQDLTNKSSYIVYFDENDYVLWVEEDEFAVDQYVLIERISIETTSRDGLSKTTTASVIGAMENATNVNNAYNSVALQEAYQQAKTTLGTSTWDARARLRFSNGTVRTVTLDDSKNYRTDKDSDLSNYNAVTDNGYTSVSGSNGSGDGDGNWIASDFTAGNLVRYSTSNGAYKLHRITTQQGIITNFGISNHVMGKNNPNSRATLTLDGTSTRISADSETRFVVEDTESNSWKYYTGIKNAPDIMEEHDNGDDTTSMVYNATAYVYHRDGTAKLIYVTNGVVSSSSSDILFIAANSASKLITANDTDDYFTFNAVEKGEIKTISIKNGTTLKSDFKTLYISDPFKDDGEDDCVILNKVNYDSNDLVVSGSWNSATLHTDRVQGIRRVNSEEVKINTYYSSSTRDLAENVRVYFIDGGDIERIEVSEIATDNMDLVYYVEEDGEITYLFIVDNDEEVAQTNNESVFYAGEFEVTNAAGDRLTYHYDSNMSIRRADVLAALAKTLGLDVADCRALNDDDDGNYVFEMSNGETYTVSWVQDGGKLVTGAINVNHDFEVLDTTKRVEGKDAEDKVIIQYIVDSTVSLKLFDVPVGADVHVDAYNNSNGNELSVDATVYTRDSDGNVQVDFVVPNVAFRVTVAVEHENNVA